MKKLCVIGDPVAHSQSPLIHNTMLKALGLDGEYHYGRERVAGSDTALFLGRARAEGCVGFNATMPHKENLLPHMDFTDVDALRCGSVNTVCMREGGCYGYNTDGRGLVAALGEEGLTLPGRHVTLLGAGGAAKSVALKLTQQGAVRVNVCNRTPERAEHLCRLEKGTLRPGDFSTDTLCRRAAESFLLVNCTSLGMEGTAGQFEDFSFLEALPAGATVCDLIYAPAETELLRRARALGHHTMNGLGMLLWQAIYALEFFINQKLDGPAMAALLRKTLT